jgi:lipid II:glycine glycyltransferase (peptidoglycan interpeptide bridge formation enzyme)
MNALEWNKLVQKNAPPFGAFLQSWEWGELQKKMGFSVRRVYCKDDHGELIAQCILQPLPFKRSYWFVPKGPLGTMSPQDMLSRLKSELNDGDFIKIEPDRPLPGCIQATERHPAATSLLTLGASYGDLRNGMKEKTRYNIGVGLRKGVTVALQSPISDLPIFLDLMAETAKRDGFHPHTEDRYRALLEVLNTPNCQAFLAIAYLKGTPLAANIMIDAFGTRTYVHGASSSTNRNAMAPYVLHAELIKDACEKGFAFYDFWGIAPPAASPEHAWQGITRFKKGFGGHDVVMSGTFDIPRRRLGYGLYSLARRLQSLV